MVVVRNNGLPNPSDPNPNSFSVLKNMGYTQQNITNVRKPSDDFTSVEAQNVALKIDTPDVKLDIQVPHFQADLYDKTPNDPLNFTDFASFDIDLKKGIVTIADKELSYTASKAVAEATNNTVKSIDINFVPGNIISAQIKGKKIIPFNFQVEGMAHPNPINNMVRFTPEKINLNGIPIKGILDFFHLEVGELVKVKDKRGRFFTTGDSIYFSPTKFVTSPNIQGNITALKTTQGHLSVGVGNENPDVNMYQAKQKLSADNYLSVQGGNVNFNGFNLLHTDLTLVDGTPENPFDVINDPSKKVITTGQVTIPEEFIANALKQKAGSGSMKDMTFTMPKGQGKLKASMWGFVPISLDLKFGRTSSGELKVTPDKGKVLGFIPLPDSLLRKTLMKETEGQVDGDGVTINLDKLADLKTSPLTDVRTEQGKLILQM